MTRSERQKEVSGWAVDAFGPEEALSVPHRGLRMLEEADEGAQAAGVTREMAHKMWTTSGAAQPAILARNWVVSA